MTRGGRDYDHCGGSFAVSYKSHTCPPPSNLSPSLLGVLPRRTFFSCTLDSRPIWPVKKAPEDARENVPPPIIQSNYLIQSATWGSKDRPTGGHFEGWGLRVPTQNVTEGNASSQRAKAHPCVPGSPGGIAPFANQQEGGGDASAGRRYQ